MIKQKMGKDHISNSVIDYYGECDDNDIVVAIV